MTFPRCHDDGGPDQWSRPPLQNCLASRRGGVRRCWPGRRRRARWTCRRDRLRDPRRRRGVRQALAWPAARCSSAFSCAHPLLPCPSWDPSDSGASAESCSSSSAGAEGAAGAGAAGDSGVAGAGDSGAGGSTRCAGPCWSAPWSSLPSSSPWAVPWSSPPWSPDSWSSASGSPSQSDRSARRTPGRRLPGSRTRPDRWLGRFLVVRFLIVGPAGSPRRQRSAVLRVRRRGIGRRRGRRRVGRETGSHGSGCRACAAGDDDGCNYHCFAGGAQRTKPAEDSCHGRFLSTRRVRPPPVPIGSQRHITREKPALFGCSPASAASCANAEQTLSLRSSPRSVRRRGRRLLRVPSRRCRRPAAGSRFSR